MTKFLYVTSCFSLFLFLYSCKGAEKEKMISEIPGTSQTGEANIIRTFYNIPSPSEQLNNLRELDGKSFFDNLLSPNDAYLYNTKSRRLIVFGAYAADASYLASKAQKGEIVNYLAVLRTISTDLGMQNLLSHDLVKTLTQPNKSPDSLFMMADKYYINAFDEMIASDKGADLGLILYGGWLETMNIAIESSYGFDKSVRINKFIAEQKMVAENLMSYLLDYQENPTVAEITEEMGAILTIYENMECTYTETKVNRTGQNLVLNGGEKCTLSNAVFSELKSKIHSLRNQHTK